MTSKINIQKVLSISILDKIKNIPSNVKDEIDFSKLINNPVNNSTLFLFLDTYEKANMGIKNEKIKDMYTSIRHKPNSYGLRVFSIDRKISDQALYKACQNDLNRLKDKLEAGYVDSKYPGQKNGYKKIMLYTIQSKDKDKDTIEELVDMTFFSKSGGKTSGRSPSKEYVRKITKLLFNSLNYPKNITLYLDKDRRLTQTISIRKEPYIPYYLKKKDEVSDSDLGLSKEEAKIRTEVLLQYKIDILKDIDLTFVDKLKSNFSILKLIINENKGAYVKTKKELEKENEEIVINYKDKIRLIYANEEKIEGQVINITPQNVYQVQMQDSSKYIELLPNNKFIDINSDDDTFSGSYVKVTEELKKQEALKEKQEKMEYTLKNSFPEMNKTDDIYFYPEVLIDTSDIEKSEIYGKNEKLTPLDYIKVFTNVEKLQEVSIFAGKKTPRKNKLNQLSMEDMNKAADKMTETICKLLFHEGQPYYDSSGKEYTILNYEINGNARGEEKATKRIFIVNIELYITEDKMTPGQLKKMKCTKQRKELQGLLGQLLGNTFVFTGGKPRKYKRKSRKTRRKMKRKKLKKTKRYKFKH
tara:strand:+ start:1604 stop:3358 length:1755 start_codon:yes stop_codon:yes gene_type:complete